MNIQEENKVLIKKNISLRFDIAQLKELFKKKGAVVVEAQVSIQDANEKLDKANDMSERVEKHDR